MLDPEKYRKTNIVQRKYSKKYLHKFLNKFQWRSDGLDKVLDIGCGTGDVTLDILLPSLPKTFKYIIATDLSEDMINYAKQYNSHSKIEYKTLDISSEFASEISDDHKFDHITSFYCLHWITNDKQLIAIRNIYDLLDKNGDCLLIIVGRTLLQQQYLLQKNIEKFAPYMWDAEQYISPYEYELDVRETFRKYLKIVGFTEFQVNIENFHKSYDYNSFRNFVESVNPFINRMPNDCRKDYIEYTMETLVRLYPSVCNRKTGHVETIFSHDLIVVFARK